LFKIACKNIASRRKNRQKKSAIKATTPLKQAATPLKQAAN